MAQIRVHILRHGTTRGNTDGLLIGWTDIHVTEEGREEIKELIKTCVYPKVEKIYCSTLIRTRETANLIYPNRMPEVLEGLKEINLGDVEEMAMEEVVTLENYNKWVYMAPDCMFPGGESALEVRLRVMAAFTHIIQDCMEKGYKDVAIISHGAAIRNLTEACLITEEDMRNFIIMPNAMGYTAIVDTDEWFADQKMHFEKYIPEGAKRPGPDEFPFFILPEEE